MNFENLNKLTPLIEEYKIVKDILSIFKEEEDKIINFPEIFKCYQLRESNREPGNTFKLQSIYGMNRKDEMILTEEESQQIIAVVKNIVIKRKENLENTMESYVI